MRYELRGTAAWLTLNRPEVRNALDDDVAQGLCAGLDRATNDHARTVVVTGAGRAFCAGANLAAVLASGADVAAFVGGVAAAVTRLRDYPVPTIAAVNGAAFAGGLELAFACDLIVAADTAKLADAHATYGLFPGGGGAAILPRLIGPARAKHLLFTGEPVPAGQLVAAGLVNEVVPAGELVARVEALCATLARRSREGLGRMKRVANAALDLPRDEALALEFAVFAEQLASADAQEGLRAFADGRTPDFR